MNIALITNDFLPSKGGIANVMKNVSNKLTELGETVYVFNKSYHNKEKLYFKILSNDNSLRGLFLYHLKFFFFMLYLIFRILFSFRNIKIKAKLKLVFFYCFYLKFIVRRIVSIRNLVSHFNKIKIDVILSGTANIPLLYSYVLSKWFNVPLVSIAHGDDFLKRYPLKIRNLIVKDSHKIIVTNKVMRNLFLKIYNVNPNKIEIIHLGVDPKTCEVAESISELRTKLNISKDDFTILTVSRFYPRKGFETILKALKQIVNEYENLKIKYLIIGGGEEQQRIEFMISQLNLEKYVSLLGNVDDILKNQYFKLSDLFILVPEVKKGSIEGFGIVYIEANYFKLPVIGTRTGGVRIAVEDEKTGFLIDPKDDETLKEKIMLLYQNKDLRKKLGDYGHNRVVEFFNWGKNGLLYRKILKSAIEENKNKKIND